MKRLLIVEGYMDAISLFQRGITNVVASLGTALTDAQGRLLRKSTEQVILGYDADGAGQAAIVRGMDILQSMGCDIRVLQISGAKDPDEYVIKYGPDRFRKCMDDAISVVEYKVKNLKKDLNLENVSDKIKFLNAIAKILSEVDNSMEREVYVDKIANTYNISKEAIYSEINKKLYSAKGASAKTLEAKPNIVRPKQEEKVDEQTSRREQMVIYLLINYPKESLNRIKQIVSIESIKSEKNKNIIQTLYNKLSPDESSDNVLNWFEDNDIINYISGILAYDFEINDVEKGIEDIEKVYKSKLKPLLEKNGIKVLLHLPVLDHMVMKKIRNELVTAFGGRFQEIIIGGAAFNREVEAFFKKIGFPFTVGYGMTECAPIISYDDWKTARLYSCGKAAPNMEIRIDSEDPENIPGEVLVRGMNVFLGYFKNPEATAAVFTPDGWFRTGDMGVMDKDGYLYLKGRSKCMILGPSGQNIYPEEIESVLNNMPYVVDSLVIEDDGALTALIYPDFHQAELDGISGEMLKNNLDESLVHANQELPNYARIKKIEIMPEDFERTPKRSIKRYLYQRN